MAHRSVSLMLQIIVLSGAVAVAAPPVRHPNLPLNRDEITQVKTKIAKYPWAAAALEKTKEHAVNGPGHENSFLNQALYFTFTGDKTFADRARAELLDSAKSELPEFRRLDVAKNPEFGSWSPWGARAWTYDLVYDTCSDAERAQIEEWLRVSCRVLIDTCKRWSTTPNLMFGKHLNGYRS
jgi:ribosomal protein S4